MTSKDVRIRHQCMLGEKLSERLEKAASTPSATKSSIIEAALEAWLDHQHALHIEQAFARRLDKMSGQIALVQRHMEVALETLALFIQFEILINAHRSSPDKSMYGAANRRFSSFVDQVGQNVAKGKLTIPVPADQTPSSRANPMSTQQGEPS